MIWQVGAAWVHVVAVALWLGSAVALLSLWAPALQAAKGHARDLARCRDLERRIHRWWGVGLGLLAVSGGLLVPAVGRLEGAAPGSGDGLRAAAGLWAAVVLTGVVEWGLARVRDRQFHVLGEEPAAAEAIKRTGWGSVTASAVGVLCALAAVWCELLVVWGAVAGALGRRG